MGKGTFIRLIRSPSFFFGMEPDDVFWDGRATSTLVNPLDESEVVIASGGALES